MSQPVVPILVPGATATGEIGLPVIAGVSLLLATIHVVGHWPHFLDVVPRSRLLSLGSGVSVAYVFVQVLPEVQQASEAVDRRGGILTFVEQHVYLAALLGFVVFYGLERYVKRKRTDGPENATMDGVFWVHIGSFGLYNVIIGYLLVHRERPGIMNLVLFAFAIGLHLLVTDYDLRDEHLEEYERIGRWVLAAAILCGTALGVAVSVSEAVLGLLFSFLAGSIVLNVVKGNFRRSAKAASPRSR
ncbi:hypothetical protein VB779_22245 [Haloarculaceae archaeon H-GB11]|nr:hypothetical protein [Haloarculaceae archaeon H-GB11]